MLCGPSNATHGELSCASFFEVPPHLAPTSRNQPDDGGHQSPNTPRSRNALDKNQKASEELLKNDVANNDTNHVNPPSPLAGSLFFFPSPRASAPQLAAPAPEPDISSSPAALWLSSFTTPKAEPKCLEDDEGRTVGGYTLGPVVGFGGFSTIRKAFSTSGGIVAIKIIRRADLVRTGHAPQERKKLEHEALVWSSLSHEHILPLFSAVHTSYADYFITIYCPAGSLYDILKRDGNPALPQDDAGMMFRQVVRGLRYLHEDAMLVHRDIKLENVLVDESGVCRIGDFGLSVKIGEPQVDEDAVWEGEQHEAAAGYNTVHRAFSLSLPKRPSRNSSSLNPIARHNSARQRSATNMHPHPHVNQPGSLPYAAPELLLPQSAEISLPHPSQDIWALGVMLYALLAGHLPFNDAFEPRLQMKILNGAFDVPKDIGRGAEHILHGCLERNISKRWTIAMVDEVAWGVGWGAAGDGATPDVEHEICFSPNDGDLEDYQPHNVVDSIIHDDEDDWENEEIHSRAAMEAATRRSTSRAQRSLSRAPILPRTTSARSMSRHRQSRPPSPGPRSALSPSTSSFLHNSNLDSDYDSLHSPLVSPCYYDTPSRSRSASRPRGRLLNKRRSYYPSRSPSPSVVPTTPVDFGSHLMARMHLEDHPEELELDPAPARGRSMYAPGFQDDDSSDEHVDHEMDFGTKPSQLSAPSLLASRWPRLGSDGRGLSSDGSDSSSRDTSLDFSLRRQAPAMDRDATIRMSSRPGSTPPASASLQNMWAGVTSPRQSKQDAGVASKELLLSGAATPAIISRSRSAEDPKPTPAPVEVGAGAD